MRRLLPAVILGTLLLGGTHAAWAFHSSKAQSYLGVDVADLDSDEGAAIHSHENHGAVITRVDHDGPAGKAGLCVHDVVVQINGQDVANQEQLRRILHDLSPGHPVKLTVDRSGQMIYTTAVLANREEVEKHAWEKHWVVPAPTDNAQDAASEPEAPHVPMAHSFMSGHLLLSQPRIGVALEQMTEQLAQFFGAHANTGLLVDSVEADSAAEMAGIHAGDVLLRVNGHMLQTKSDWTHSLHDAKGKDVSVVLLRDRHELTVTLPTDLKKRSALDDNRMNVYVIEASAFGVANTGAGLLRTL